MGLSTKKMHYITLNVTAIRVGRHSVKLDSVKPTRMLDVVKSQFIS